MKPKPGMCVECGSLNALGLPKCGNCGADIPVPLPEDEGAGEPARKCKWCGNTVGSDEDVCSECRKRKSDTVLRDASVRRRTGSPSRRLTLGAIFLMFTGVASLGWGALLVAVESMIFELSGYSAGVGACGIIMALLGIVSLAGGALAIGRRSYVMALIGSFCSFLCVALFVGTFLGLIGMVVIGVPIGIIGPWLIYSTDAEFG